MKKYIVSMALCFLPVMAAAQTAPLLNWGDFFHSVRAGYGIDQHGQKTTVFYTPVLTYHTTAGIDLISFNIGYEGTQKRPTTMLGVRFDNLMPLFFSNTWGQTHIKSASLPSFECGPFISAWPENPDNLWQLTIRYGLGAAVGF